MPPFPGFCAHMDDKVWPGSLRLNCRGQASVAEQGWLVQDGAHNGGQDWEGRIGGQAGGEGERNTPCWAHLSSAITVFLQLLDTG